MTGCEKAVDVTLLFTNAGIEIYIFCLTFYFWCWRKSHCRSPIATKGLCSAVSLLFCPTFAWSFSHFYYKEVPDLQKNQPFLTYFIQYFSLKIPSCIVIMFPTTLKSKAEQGWYFCKANIAKSKHFISNFQFKVKFENWK